jgi:hypothetical protein
MPSPLWGVGGRLKRRADKGSGDSFHFWSLKQRKAMFPSPDGSNEPPPSPSWERAKRKDLIVLAVKSHIAHASVTRVDKITDVVVVSTLDRETFPDRLRSRT